MDVNLQKIDHIVVLMMENRSFDHMLGFLKLAHDLRSHIDHQDDSHSLLYRRYRRHPEHGRARRSFGPPRRAPHRKSASAGDSEGRLQSLIDQAARWHEAMVHAGIGAQGNPVAHQLSDFQADFLGAKRELLAARKQIGAAAGL